MSGIEITPEVLDGLREKAYAAVPGPWKAVEIPGPDCSEDLRIVPCDAYGNSRGDGPIGDVFSGYKRPVTENASFITAANPALVLALLAEIERLNQRYDEQKLLATRMIEHAAGQKTDFATKRQVADPVKCNANAMIEDCTCCMNVMIEESEATRPAVIDHLIKENKKLKAELERINNLAQGNRVLRWVFDGSGEWTAESRYHDDGLQFKWVIGVCDDGTFTLAGSDSELGCKIPCFRTLAEAKEYCQTMEKD